MIKNVLKWSLENRALVLLIAVVLAVLGVLSVKNTSLDAIPDLSDVQVIIRTTYAGQAPTVVEDQVTYPIASAMLAVPGSTVVRGYSFFGDSYVYVLFKDHTDPYWARSRVLEYLNQVTGKLPAGARPELGPDATGVGWVYEYALVDRTKQHDLSQLRSLQDWYLKYELQKVPGVAEVAAIGGMVKQYQVVLDPDRLRAYRITISTVREAIVRANQETGGSSIEIAEAEYVIRAKGYIQSIDEMRQIPVALKESSGTPVLLGDVAQIRLGPQMRRGIAELDGQGEVAGGIVVMRWGQNALSTIEAVKKRMQELRSGLPQGVEIVETYDRSGLIHRAIDTLRDKLIEEFLVVVAVCAVFLFHIRSALVAVVILPMGILTAYIVMYLQGVTSNIMSLGGIAIAIGAMVDASIVMIENAHKHLEKAQGSETNRWQAILAASSEVGPALFFSLLIITLSFVPVFTLEAQEGKLFAPLAYTKTYAMAAAAGLSVTLMPVLMGWVIRGPIPQEHNNPLSRLLISLYLPVIRWVLAHPKKTVVFSLLAVASTVVPVSRLGSEFMPDMDEGDLLYMPTTFAAISAGKASEVLQITDRLIKSIPEVKTVFGKIGRADTATDPAPLSMVETTIQLKPRDQWRPGMTMAKLMQELDHTVRLPGLTNAWVMPIKTRIDMTSTGIKTALGIKVSGADLDTLQKIAQEIETLVKGVAGAASVFAERITGGRYILMDIDRRAAARYGLNIADVQDVIADAVGGATIGYTVEGLERYPINIRFAQESRDSVEKLRQLPMVTANGASVTLGQIAHIDFADGPDMVRSENARRSAWVYVDVRGRDLGGFVDEAKKIVSERVALPKGYSIGWSGQYEYLERAKERLMYIVPLTLAIILILLYLNFKNFTESLMVMGAVPLSLVGAFWLVYFLDYHMSVAVWVGMIALAGVAAEFGIVMLVYLDQALQQLKPADMKGLHRAIIYGTVMRVRPKAMTAAVILAGLFPIVIGDGTGSEVMRRIAAPMLGGMITAPLVSMVLIPALYLLWKTPAYAGPFGRPSNDKLNG
ncbi:MAG: efflux RND transporter permease subunit [Pseudomonadota bacterium]